MTCSEIQSTLALYADGFAGEGESVSSEGHLNVCPLCRQKYAEYREIGAGLRQIRRPEISVALRDKLKESIRTELLAGKRSWLPVSSSRREWLQMRVMPYSVGAFASVLAAFTFLTMMFSGMLKPEVVPLTARDGETSIMLASNSNPFRNEDSAQISPADFAKSRLGFASESPSINPRGALIALTKSFVRGGMKDDEVVVVADVYRSGLAQIAEVVEPSRDRRAVSELEKALESDRSFTPFVSAELDGRGDSVRVVLKFQSVNVSTGLRSARNRSARSL
ncbi:MAG: hypothetical protein ABIO36_04195 [Pyrinomonadaceae bacterium]